MLVRLVFLSALLTLAAARTSYNGWVTENVITGTTLQAPEGFAWDDQGFMYVTDAYTSVVAKIPVSALPINSESSFVWKKKYDQSSDQANGIIFKDGRLYLTQLSGGRVLEISPVDGRVIRVVTTAINGPIDMHLDPLSGDVFVSALNGAAIHRIQNIGTVPIVSVYANFQNGIDGFSFSADGSIYACLLGSDQVWKALGTNQASPSPSFFFNKVRPDGNAVTSCNGVESLIVDSATTGSIHSVPLLNPSAATVIVDGVSTKMDLARVGPDGKFYISMHYDNNQVRAFRLFNTGCTFTTDPSTQPGNFPGSSPCAGGNCPKATAAPECAAVAFHSASKCATLSFSTTTSNCPQL